MNMNKKPLVSIVIPVYNGADFLSEAINSALAQTYDNIEILVVNDGSTDDGKTTIIAQSYGTKIRYFEKENGGVSTALNLGIREMKGAYFSWLSHDDLFADTKVEKQILFLKEQGKSCLIYSNYIYIDSNGKHLSLANGIKSRTNRNFTHLLLSDFPINGITTLIHKSILDEVGFFNEELKTSQDYDYWFRCSKKFTMVFFPQVVAYSRLHPNQGTRTNKLMKFEGDVLYTQIARYFFSTESSQKLRRQEIFECISFLLINNFYSSAMMFIRCLNSSTLKLLFYIMLILYPGRKYVRNLFLLVLNFKR